MIEDGEIQGVLSVSRFYTTFPSYERLSEAVLQAVFSTHFIREWELRKPAKDYKQIARFPRS